MSHQSQPVSNADFFTIKIFQLEVVLSLKSQSSCFLNTTNLQLISSKNLTWLYPNKEKGKAGKHKDRDQTDSANCMNFQALESVFVRSSPMSKSFSNKYSYENQQSELLTA